MTFTEVVTRFRNPSSERTVVEMRSVSISKHPRPAAAAAPVVRPAAAEPGVRDASERTALEPFTETALTITDFVRYQGASGDFNAIHHDTAFAQASGYPGPFAVGMLTAGIAANYVTAHFGVNAVRRIRVRVRWKDQAWPGDALTYPGFPPAARSGGHRRRRSGRRGSRHPSRWPVPPAGLGRSRKPG